jgi:hypothetical protein
MLSTHELNAMAKNRLLKRCVSEQRLKIRQGHIRLDQVRALAQS